jgi:hypothetical protein
MELHKAVIRQELKEFIKKRKMMLLIDSMESSNVEVLLEIKFDELSQLQELLPHDFFDDHYINGDVREDYFQANINDIMLWAELTVDDFIDQLETMDQEKYEGWQQKQNAKSA